MEILISDEIISAYSEVNTDKSGYISVCGLDTLIVFHADVKEIVKMAISHKELTEPFSFRLPTEILNSLIKHGKLEFTYRQVTETKTCIDFKHYKSDGSLTVKITVPYEACIVREQITELTKIMLDDNCSYIEDLSVFNKALLICSPNSKAIPIAGVQIKKGKLTAISSGYYAESSCPDGLIMTIPTSTLTQIRSFLAGYKRVKFKTANGYNFLIIGNNCLGWRRMRTEEVSYTVQEKQMFSFNADTIRTVTDCITSPIASCVLSINRRCLEIKTVVASITIPMTIKLDNEILLPDFKINVKLFFALLKKFKGLVSVGFYNKALVLSNNGIKFVIGRSI